MKRLAETADLSSVQRDILSTVREFVNKEILPHASALEHADDYPDEIVRGLREMGLFGLTIPEEYGGVGESLLTYALVVEELSRGWMSISGIINTHFIVAYLLRQYGTAEQKQHYLPSMASGDIRGAFSMSEPGCGSDVAAIRTRAVRDADDWIVNGQKMWLTNGARASVVMTLVKTEVGGDSPYRNLTAMLVDKEPGFGVVGNGMTVPPAIDKMGYKGVETTELIFQGTRIAGDRVLGGPGGVGRGFYQMMDGIEVGRVNVAARGCGVALRAFELAIVYAQHRVAFGHPIGQHQAIQFKLAEMATKIEAAHALMIRAARVKDSGNRNDLEAGMAKYLAAEFCVEVVQDSLRIHGGFGYTKESEIERLYREAPLLLIGEGTAEIQKMVIGRRLLEDYRIAT
jgi:alkylation response protein AidB-like acyl-CoA dehydrogenase